MIDDRSDVKMTKLTAHILDDSGFERLSLSSITVEKNDFLPSHKPVKNTTKGPKITLGLFLRPQYKAINCKTDIRGQIQEEPLFTEDPKKFCPSVKA